MTDLREMRIPNVAVLALTAVFLVAGLIVLPLGEYGMRLVQLVVVLVAGFVITSLGLAVRDDARHPAEDDVPQEPLER
jgi:prepilin peptidase CpaA